MEPEDRRPWGPQAWWSPASLAAQVGPLRSLSQWPDAGSWDRLRRCQVRQCSGPASGSPRLHTRTHTHTCMHTHAHTKTCTNTHMRRHAHTLTHVHTRAHRHRCTHRDMHKHVHACTHMHTCSHAHMCTHEHTQRHAHAHTHAHTHNESRTTLLSEEAHARCSPGRTPSLARTLRPTDTAQRTDPTLAQAFSFSPHRPREASVLSLPYYR